MRIPLVSVCMITYNHEPYIAEAVEGVLMQQTTFPIELIISEDCSTDSTRTIVRKYAEKYPDIIVADLPEKNRGMIANFYHCLLLAKSKYIALCEGDDYWTDPLKLQKQLDFLEANPDIAVCYTKRIDFIQKTNQYISKPLPEVLYTSFEAIIQYNPVPTLTTMIRRDALFEYLHEIQPQHRSWKIGDYPIWLWMAIKYKIHGMEDVTAVYRVLEESASHLSRISERIAFSNSFHDIRVLYNRQYSLGLNDRVLKSEEAYRNLKMCFEAKEYKMLLKQFCRWFKEDHYVFFQPKLFKKLINKRTCN